MFFFPKVTLLEPEYLNLYSKSGAKDSSQTKHTHILMRPFVSIGKTFVSTGKKMSLSFSPLGSKLLDFRDYVAPSNKQGRAKRLFEEAVKCLNGQDVELAEKKFLKAGKLGNHEAFYKCAKMKARFGSKNEASDLYKKAANMGNMAARAEYLTMLLKEEVSDIAFLDQAREKGYDISDKKKMATIFKNEAESGSSLAKMNYADLLYWGEVEGCGNDDLLIEALYQSVCAKNDLPSSERVSSLIQRAQDHIETSAIQGSEKALTCYMDLLENGHIAQPRQAIITKIKEAADKNNIQAIECYTQLMLKGQLSLSKSEENAVLKHAADCGDIAALGEYVARLAKNSFINRNVGAVDAYILKAIENKVGASELFSAYIVHHRNNPDEVKPGKFLASGKNGRVAHVAHKKTDLENKELSKEEKYRLALESYAKNRLGIQYSDDESGDEDDDLPW